MAPRTDSLAPEISKTTGFRFEVGTSCCPRRDVGPRLSHDQESCKGRADYRWPRAGLRRLPKLFQPLAPAILHQ